MMLFARTRCARCGSRRDVKVVTYVRPGSGGKLREPWCQRCRRAKLIKRKA